MRVLKRKVKDREALKAKGDCLYLSNVTQIGQLY